MSFELPAFDENTTESDVEQKLIYPLITSHSEVGLRYLAAEVLTKLNIRKLSIDKGGNKKVYFPDYLIVIRGYPLLIIEAKKPGESLEEAYREARLYAHELNATFPTDINPVKKIIATDGVTLVAGNSDQSEPDITLLITELTAANEKYSLLYKAFNRKALDEICSKFDQTLRPTYLSKPRRLVGGRAIQDEEIGHNTFGANIASEFGHIFNPATIEDRKFIAVHGYIPSKRRERFIDPIDKIIRAAKPPSEIDATAIEDTSSPREIVNILKKPGKSLERKVILLVGSVGSGKTTFIDYLKEVALPREIIESTAWIRINMNEAPISEGEIYNWLRQEIIDGCKESASQYDFDSLEGIKKVYAVELHRFEKVYGPLYKGTPEYNIKLAEKIEELEKDLHLSSLAYTRFCSTERAKLLILVLDNCDKRTLHEQLLMFQAAQWLQKEYRALVILPLREETYDNHRDQPPLDTALKDFVFRIEPPLFQNVLAKRVQLAMREIGKNSHGALSYELPNGYTVEYSKNDTSFYLACILKSIFDNDKYVRRIIVGLSARNIRRALEIFLEFCTSGHIKEDEIFKIRQSQGTHTLPLHTVSRVLMRMNRRYYDGDFSHVKNVFATTSFGNRGNYFSRLIILRWLKENFYNYGSSGVKGYFSVETLKANLTPYGLDSEIITRDIEYLLAGHCLISEDFRVSQITDQDLIRLGPAGFVHLELLTNIHYIAALSEDTLYTNEALAKGIAQRIKDLELQYNHRTVYENAHDFFSFISKEHAALSEATSSFLDDSDFSKLASLKDMEESLSKFKRDNLNSAWASAESTYTLGSIHSGEIIKQIVHGLIIKMPLGMTALMHKNQLPQDYQRQPEYSIGNNISVVIKDIDVFNQKIKLDREIK